MLAPYYANTAACIAFCFSRPTATQVRRFSWLVVSLYVRRVLVQFKPCRLLFIYRAHIGSHCSATQVTAVLFHGPLSLSLSSPFPHT